MSNPAFRPTDRSLPIALLRARETVMAPIRDMLQASGLTEQKWRVLRVLDERGAQEQTALAGAACLLLPSLTRILRVMEADGLCARVADANDGRKSIVSLTDAGRQILLDHAAESAAIFTALETQFGRAKMEKLLDLLEELNRC
ncbi:MAG: homoprotocatechuate degradation operon regulator HpaR [Sulfitobacter sp.]